MHRAGQCADELFALNVGDAELTPRQFAVLRAIADSDEPSQTTLVEKTGIDRSTMADIVRRLNSKGLLQRRRTRRDARMYAVRLTDRGIAALKLAEPAARSTDERILASLAAHPARGIPALAFAHRCRDRCSGRQAAAAAHARLVRPLLTPLRSTRIVERATLLPQPGAVIRLPAAPATGSGVALEMISISAYEPDRRGAGRRGRDL